MGSYSLRLLGSIAWLAFGALSACSPPVLKPVDNLPPVEEPSLTAPPGSQALARPVSHDTQDPPETPPTRTPQSLVLATQKPPTSTPEPRGELCSPLENHSLEDLVEIVSRPYDPPPEGREEDHHGVDFSYYRRGERQSIRGVVVQSVLPGWIAASLADQFPYGNALIMETPLAEISSEWIRDLGVDQVMGRSLYVLYAHLESPPQVTLGQRLEACHPLGTVGSSGNAGVAHLHLEMRSGPSGERFEHMAYYLAQTTPEERAGYERWRTGGQFRHFDPMRLFLLAGTGFVDP